jgi:S-DNA-T family DNA segregation ATPase FtsK/SpoIIIE
VAKTNKNTFNKTGAKSKKPAKAGMIAKCIKALKQPKAKRVIGLFVLLFACYLTIAFISFAFSWQEDQSLIRNKSWLSLLFDPSIRVENYLGKFGALISNKLIYQWFGLAAFFVIFDSIILGFKIGFNLELLPLGKTIRHSLYGMLWFSLFFGYFFPAPVYFFGGGLGFELNEVLIAAIGSVGTALLILITGSAYLLYVFDHKLLQWKQKIMSIVGSETNLNTEKEDSLNDIIRIAEEAASAEDDDALATFENEIEFDDASKEEEQESEVIEPVTVENSDEDDFEIEIPKEEEVAVGEEAAKDESSKLEVTKNQESTLSKSEMNDKLKEFGEFDPKLDLSSYELPHIDLLEPYGSGIINVSKEELEENKNKIVETLGHYKIEISKIKATIGPTVTLYELIPAPGVRISKIKNLEDDIALSLAALGIRIIAPMPGKGTIGIEVPNSKPEIVAMRSLLSSKRFQNSDMELPVALGKTIQNETFVADLAKMPHLLMAGATGQGKSVGLNAILVSLLYKKHPSQIKFVLVDPKKVELTLFNKIERHFLAKLPDSEEAIITDTQKVVTTLNSLCVEMDNRYEMLKQAEVRNLKEYNTKFIQRKLNPEKGHKYLPYIILVVDEFADLIMTAGKEVELPIARLAQLARAIGIHLIIATQRPSVNIITGTIKANFPSRIAFRVTSKIDSRTILDAGGADQLIGRGDMLYSTGSDLLRLQCGFVDTHEVDKITEFIGNQRAYPTAFELPEYEGDDEGGSAAMDVASERDVMFEDAARVIVLHQQGSTSLIQRKLKLGYNRAGRIVDQLESAGIVGPFKGSKAREVLMPDEYALEQFLNASSEK